MKKTVLALLLALALPAMAQEKKKAAPAPRVEGEITRFAQSLGAPQGEVKDKSGKGYHFVHMPSPMDASLRNWKPKVGEKITFAVHSRDGKESAVDVRPK